MVLLSELDPQNVKANLVLHGSTDDAKVRHQGDE